jgi:hypothetical protein
MSLHNFRHFLHRPASSCAGERDRAAAACLQALREQAARIAGNCDRPLPRLVPHWAA